MANISQAQNQIALNAFSQQAAGDLNLDLANKGDWSQNERIAYINEFKGLIADNPNMVSDTSIAIARNIDTTGLALSNFLTDTVDINRQALIASLSGGVDFAETLADTAGNITTAAINDANAVADALNGLGQGLSNASKIAPYILPVAGVLFLYMATRSGSKRIASNKWLS